MIQEVQQIVLEALALAQLLQEVASGGSTAGSKVGTVICTAAASH